MNVKTKSGTAPIPVEHAEEIRRLAHDLSNSMEIIVQTSFLLGTVNLDGEAKKWLEMLDAGVNKAIERNQELRDYIRANS